MELVSMLTQTLGMNESQAKGGAGLLFGLAKEKLGGDFGQVEAAVPGMGDLLSAAPAGGGLGSALGGLAQAVGGGTGQLGGLASLAGGFSKLGLDAGMVGKFLPVILSFVQSKGGDSVKNLLAGALQ
jgi:hypothetical protein